MGPLDQTDALSVDLPQEPKVPAGDLIVQEQCCSLVSDTDLSLARQDQRERRRKVSEKLKSKAKSRPKKGFWPCGHPQTFADFDDKCYFCSQLAPDAPTRELSRRRIDRRQRAAQRLLVGFAPLLAPMDSNDDHQITKRRRRGRWFPVTACRIVPLDVGMSLEQWSNGKVDRHGVFHCGSVWTCPSCSQRVAVTRSADIRDVQIGIAKAGGVTVMITWTIPHDRVTPLAVSMDRLKTAFRHFRSDQTVWKRLKKDCGYLGHVTSTEITLALAADPKDPLTFFDNGWHCHAHSLMGFRFEGAKAMSVIEEAAFSIMLKELMFPSWVRAVQKAKAPRAPSFEHGFDVRPAWSADTYIQKMEEIRPSGGAANGKKPRWGVEAELTKSYMKEGRKKSRTPFELLDSDAPRDHDLYREYSRATFGRSQIEWSRGEWDLRRQFLGDRPEMTDEQAAAATPQWEFADERVGLDDHVIEQVFIARDDCWRARKRGRNAMARAIADVDGGGCESLEKAMRQNGFVIDRVEPASIETRLVLDENLQPVTERRWVWERDRATGEERHVEEWVDVTEEVHIPKMVWVSFPQGEPPAAVKVATLVTADDCPF